MLRFPDGTLLNVVDVADCAQAEEMAVPRGRIRLAQHRQPSHPAQLQHHDCLVYSMTSNTATWPYQVDGQVQQFAVRGRLTANNGVALMQATAQGMGVALQPDFLAAPFLARQEVVEILGGFESPPLGIYAVLPSNRYIPHRVGALMEYLAGALKGP